jgi:hypothetical protein
MSPSHTSALPHHSVNPVQLVMKIFKVHQAKAKGRVDEAAKTREAEKAKPKVLKQVATITPKSPPK